MTVYVVHVQSTVNTTHLADVTNEVNSHSSPSRDPPLPTPPDCALSCQQMFSSQSLFSTPLRFSHSLYRHPLPSFQWADGGDVWRVMFEKETKLTFRRDADMFERHAALDARMRSILLDWLIEVQYALLPPTKEEVNVFVRFRLSICLSVSKITQRLVHGFG